ncbi:MAG: glycosyltransferase [Pirellulales bacterium]
MQLVVAGSHSHTPNYVEHLMSIIRRKRLEDRVHFAGHLSLAQLVALYSTCRALVLPSETECCSQTLLEALACGSSMICSDLPENRDVAEDAAIYVRIGDGDGLLKALIHIQDDSTMLEYRNRAARRRKELPDWHEVAKRFTELSISS